MPVLSIIKSSTVSRIYEIVYYAFLGTRQVRGFRPCQCLNSTIFILVTTLSIKRNYIKGMLSIGSPLVAHLVIDYLFQPSSLTQTTSNMPRYMQFQVSLKMALTLSNSPHFPCLEACYSRCRTPSSRFHSTALISNLPHFLCLEVCC